MNLMQLPDAKRQVSEEKREQRTKHNRFQIINHRIAKEFQKMKEIIGEEQNKQQNIAKDRKVIPDPIDDRKFQE